MIITINTNQVLGKMLLERTHLLITLKNNIYEKEAI